VYDQYLEPSIIGNVINDNIHYLLNVENIVFIDVPDTYKYRPELVALQYYGSEQYYPLILAANNIGSLLQFVPSRFNNQIKMIRSEVIQKLLGV
jgi:uncharacterized membrane protein